MDGAVESPEGGSQIAHEHQLAIELIRTINLPTDLHELMRSVLELVVCHTGASAVGIRLRDGDDYPYFEYRGFSDSFIRSESRLCPKQSSPSRPPQLDCMCGNVLQCRTNPTLPFFTERGSFWSNGTTALLASTSPAERQSNTRNRCNGEGYESVALIPLRHLGETFGLIQINDRRTDRFTPHRIDFLEQLADGVALALMQRQTADRLKEALNVSNTLLQEIHHRVKNSLQLISSLLCLGAGNVTDSETRTVLQLCQERIQSIALAHEMLFSSPVAAHVSVGDYLQKLLDHTLAAWQRPTVDVTTELDVDYQLDAERLVPLGLIVAELACNALRHAFPGARRGTLLIRLDTPSDRELRLLVRDDGIGLSDGVSLDDSPGFGLKMVGILSRQVGASVRLERHLGTTFVVRFPLQSGPVRS